MSSQESAGAPKGKRPRGRPRRADAPNVPWDEVDRLLVFGERVKDPKTGYECVTYPTQQKIAERFGISPSRVWQYVSRYACYRRREEARVQTQERFQQKLVEEQATQRALAAADVLGIVDQFVRQFAVNLQAGKVRTDSAADFDRVLRLREFVAGGPDSRTELQGGISLVAIQERHRRQRGLAERLTPQLTGTDEVDAPGAAAAEPPAADEVDARAHAGDAQELAAAPQELAASGKAGHGGAR